MFPDVLREDRSAVDVTPISRHSLHQSSTSLPDMSPSLAIDQSLSHLDLHRADRISFPSNFSVDQPAMGVPTTLPYPYTPRLTPNCFLDLSSHPTSFASSAMVAPRDMMLPDANATHGFPTHGLGMNDPLIHERLAHGPPFYYVPTHGLPMTPESRSL